MILVKPQRYNVLFVGDDGFYGMSAPTHLATSMTHIIYDKKTYLTNNKPIDDVVIEYINRQKPHAIMTAPQPFVEKVCGTKWIKYAIEKRIPVGLVWYDAIAYTNWVESMSFYCLNIILDDQRYEGKNKENNISVWTPIQAETREPHEERPIDVCFIGNIDCEQRSSALKFLLTKGIPVFTAGHKDWCRLEYSMLSYFLRQSKIVLNFSQNRFANPAKASLKGRVIESMLSGAMVIEDANDNTSKYFKPGKDIICYDNLQDLYEKIKHYLDNDRERINIAYNGQFRCLRDYTIRNWWCVVLPKLLKLKLKIKM